MVILSLLFFNNVSAQNLNQDQLMKQYSNPQQLQDAIDKGQIDYNQLPQEIKQFVHDKIILVSGFQGLFGLGFTNEMIIIFGIVLFVIFLVTVIRIFRPIEEDNTLTSKPGEEKTSSKTMDKSKNITFDQNDDKGHDGLKGKTHD